MADEMLSTEPTTRNKSKSLFSIIVVIAFSTQNREQGVERKECICSSGTCCLMDQV